MVLLKVVMPVMFAATVAVKVADVDCPDVRLVPALFQVMAMYELAPAGLQPVTFMLSVMVPVPVFLT